jgi:hypothetical protein
MRVWCMPVIGKAPSRFEADYENWSGEWDDGLIYTKRGWSPVIGYWETVLLRESISAEEIEKLLKIS